MLDRPRFSPESERDAAPRRRLWMAAEIARLQAVYPEGGMAATRQALPGRSTGAIYAQMNALGMGTNGNPEKRPKTRKLPTTPQIDTAIRQAYLGKPQRGQITRLSVLVNRPRPWVSARARALGLQVPRALKEPRWSDTELALLRAHGGKHPDTVRRLLADQGFKRTAGAVVKMVRRLHVAREINENIYTASALAQALGIARDTVHRWIEQGWLKARKTRPRCPQAKQANSWAIHRRDIRAFIIDNVGVIDFRKLDKVWLVELLASKVWED